METEPHIFGPIRLSHSPSLIPFVLTGFARAQTEGSIPVLRAPPSGDEQIVWAGAHAGVPVADDFAFATFYEITFQRVWIDVVFVPAHLRGKHIGQRLLRAVVQQCERVGAREVSLGTHASNAAMRRCAERAGLAVETVTMSVEIVNTFKTRSVR